MTTPAHGIQAGVAACLISTNPFWVALWIILGMMPDIAGWIDGKVRGPEYRWTKGLYGKMHHPEGIWKLLYFIPPVALHILFDIPCHKPEGGWNKEGYIIEASFWSSLLAAIIASLL